MTESPDGPRRGSELASALERVRRRVEVACLEAGRDSGEVTVIVVTKTFPASDVTLLAGLGVTHVAENRHQEAEAKQAQCGRLGLTWHFVGGLQSNKAAAVAAHADVVHSVDRHKLLAPLSRGAGERGLDVLLQISLDPPDRSGRAGVVPGDLADLAAATAATEGLRLRGLMAVAPLGEDPARAFDRLADIRDRFLTDHPNAGWLSAGMSGDLEQAIAAGATHVRVGSAILGSRAPVQ